MKKKEKETQQIRNPLAEYKHISNIVERLISFSQ